MKMKFPCEWAVWSRARRMALILIWLEACYWVVGL